MMQVLLTSDITNVAIFGIFLIYQQTDDICIFSKQNNKRLVTSIQDAVNFNVRQFYSTK